MPTHQDETLQQRYAREHQEHLALCGSMTAEQVADLQLQLNNALGREVALREELESTKVALREEMKDAFEFQQRNSALVGLLREASDYLDGGTMNSVCSSSILHKKMKEAIKPTESGSTDEQ